MPQTAILFTGQGAQSVGMGREFAERWPAAAQTFDQANDLLGYDLRQLCFEGPADQLERTDIQQPAIYTTSVAIWRAMNEGRDLPEVPVAMAGLSLGEYTALYAAGAMTFEAGLQLVRRRGELMQAAAQAIPSGMVSIMGLSPEDVDALCKAVIEGAPAGAVLVPANYNCPGQIVVSGTRDACEQVVPLIDKAGGRAIPLKVAGAFHSPIMRPAAEGLAQVLAQTALEEPQVPVVANVNCRNHTDAGTIRQWLTDQLTHPVRWQASVERLLGEGVERFIEIGPGRVLAGLMKKISRATPVVNVSTAPSLEECVAATR